MEPGELSAGDLLRGLQAGERHHWPELVARFSSMVVAVAARHRLSSDDIDDVHQAVWVRLAENIERIRNPDAIAGWLKTTARNEALRVAKRRTTDPLMEDPAADQQSVEQSAIDAERREAVATALASISERCRTLLRLLLVENRSYAEVCMILSMPVGSVGPIRQRCLAQLRSEVVGLVEVE